MERQKAPAFEGTSYDGSTVSSASLLGRPYVLFFYPKASSLGCTREARAFAEVYGPLKDVGVALVGVSVDPAEAQRRFAEECHLPFPLLADPGGKIARGHGVMSRWGLARRTTYLVGKEGELLEVVRSGLPGVHVRRVRDRFLSSDDVARTNAANAPAASGPGGGA